MSYEEADRDASRKDRDDNRMAWTGLNSVHLTLALAVIAGVVWAIRAESRIDQERELRTRLEASVALMRVESVARSERIEVLLSNMNNEVVAIRVRLGVPSMGAKP